MTMSDATYAAYAASLTEEDRDIQREMSARGLQITGAVDSPTAWDARVGSRWHPGQSESSQEAEVT